MRQVTRHETRERRHETRDMRHEILYTGQDKARGTCQDTRRGTRHETSHETRDMRHEILYMGQDKARGTCQETQTQVRLITTLKTYSDKLQKKTLIMRFEINVKLMYNSGNHDS